MAAIASTTVAVTVHYRRARRDYDGWELWAFANDGCGRDEAQDPGEPPGETIRPLPSAAGALAPRTDAFGMMFRFGIQIGIPSADAKSVKALPSRKEHPTEVQSALFNSADLSGRSLSILPRWGDWFAEDKPNRVLNVNDLVDHITTLEDSGPLNRKVYGLQRREANVYIVEGEKRMAFSTHDFYLEPGVPRFVTVSLNVGARPPPSTPLALDPSRSEQSAEQVVPVAEQSSQAVQADNVAHSRSKRNYFVAAFGENDARKDCFAGNSPAALYDFLLDRIDFSGHSIGLVAVDKAASGQLSTPVPQSAVWWTPELGHNVLLDPATNSLTPGKVSGEPAQLKKKMSLSSIVGPEHSHSRRRLIIRYQRYDPIYDGWKLQIWPKSKRKSVVDAPRYSNVYNGSAVFAMDLSLFEEPDSAGVEMSLIHPSGKVESTYGWTPSLSYDVFLLEGETELTPRSSSETFVTYTRLGAIDEWEKWELWMWGSESVNAPSKVVRVQTSSQLDTASIVFDTSCAHFPKSWIVRLQPVKVAQKGLLEAKSAAQDRARVWEGRKRGRHVFVTQGVEAVSYTKIDLATERKDLSQFIPISYRRHLSAGHEDWFLEVTDVVDEETSAVHRIPISKIYSSHVDFLIDKAVLGCGMNLKIAPVRLRRNEVIEQDGSSREWTHGDHVDCKLLLQGHPVLVTTLNDTVGGITASVGSGQQIILDTTFPVTWHHEDLSQMPFEIEQIGGSKPCKLPWSVVEQRKPTQVVLAVDPKVAAFHEDFKVEDYRVSLSGFDGGSLQWECFEDVDQYFYDGQLGCIYEENTCVFRCFAPTAQTVKLILYPTPEGADGREAIAMRKIPQGCWKAVISRDLKGIYYKLLAEGPDKRLFPGVEVIDPYARCNTSHVGRSLILGHENTSIADRPQTPATQAIIYELHLRDATIDPMSGIANKGKFLGLPQRGTTMVETNAASHPKITTGLDHILEMGVTAVQILPMQDFDNHEEVESEYRWGYMPVHFNSPDGWYASNVRSDARVREMKQLIDALHKVGLKVIMDVVYNHTAEDANEFNLEARFSFNGLAPRYYYRNCGNLPMSANGFNTCAFRDKDEVRCGTCYSNGSGCGNEFRSESPMGRKFILDSLEYWVNEYKVDGFRFDLVGLIDTETMTIAAKRLHEIDPNIMIYGEPWTAGPTPIDPTIKGTQKDRGFGVFNNNFRDALRGTPFGVEENFLMDGGHSARVKRGIMGSIDDFAASPLETINYIECHDNRTLYDHFVEYRDQRDDSIEYTEADLRRMQMLGGAIILTSQGVPFFQMGQEMCRTKGGVENSYESPDDVNMVRWSWKQSRKDVVEYYRGLVHLRKAHYDIFSMPTAQDIRKRLIFFEELGVAVPERCVGYRILGPSEGKSGAQEEDEWRAVVVLLNPTPMGADFVLPGADENNMWNVVVNDKRAGVEPLAGPLLGEVHVNGRSAMVLRRCSEKESRLACLEVRLAVVSDAFCFPVEEPVGERAVGL